MRRKFRRGPVPDAVRGGGGRRADRRAAPGGTDRPPPGGGRPGGQRPRPAAAAGRGDRLAGCRGRQGRVGQGPRALGRCPGAVEGGDRKSTRLNSSHVEISYAVFCLKKKKKNK